MADENEWEPEQNKKLGKLLDSRLLSIYMFFLGIIISSLFGLFLYQQQEKSIETQIQRDAEDLANRLYSTVTFSLESMRILAPLFHGDDYPDKDFFHYESTALRRRVVSIKTLAWIPRAAVENDLSSVFYIDPADMDPPIFGQDLALNAQMATIFNKIIRTNQPLIKLNIENIVQNSERSNFLAIMPVYNIGPTATKQLKGFIMGVLDSQVIFKNSPPFPYVYHNELDDLSWDLIDKSSNEKTVVFTTSPNPQNNPYKDMSYSLDLADIWGQKWLLTIHPTAQYIDNIKKSLPIIVIVSGFILTLALTVFTRITTTRSLKIENMIKEKNHELRLANKELEKMCVTDGLTNIANRRFLDQYIEMEWKRAMRSQTPLSFALLDIDSFKLYNDNYGHIAGDKCLQQIVRTLKPLLKRPTDLLARYGGEEFALVLPETESARQIAERCRRAIEKLEIPHLYSQAHGSPNIVTASIGSITAIPQKGTKLEHLINAADRALYSAKRSGRNRVVTADASQLTSS